MSESDRRERNAFLAFGALLGGSILSAFVLSLWSGYSLYEPRGSEGQQYEDARYHFWGDSWAQWSMAGFAVIATFVSWRALYLLRLTFRETEKTALAGVASATEARRTADAAIAANAANEMAAMETRQSEERLNRAYIAVLPADIRVMESNDSAAFSWIGHVEIRNAGKIPATNVRTLINAERSSFKDRRHFPQPDATESIGVIAPGVSVEQGSEPFEVGEWRVGFVYVYGTINYVDGFGNERLTRFCHRYNCMMTEANNRESPTFRGIDSKYARQHQYGNTAD